MTTTINDLPAAGNTGFTVKKGTGPVQNNLQTKLEYATLNSSSPLHSIKQHIGEIANVFDNSFIKRAIKSGGLSEQEQRLVFRKALKEISNTDPGIANNQLKKTALRKIISHFGIPTKAAAEEKRADLIAVRPRYQRSAVDKQNGKSSSISRSSLQKKSTAEEKQGGTSITHLAAQKPSAPKSGGYMMS